MADDATRAPTATKRQRLSLTKGQLQTEAGVELLELLVDITGDGTLSDDEIGRLHDWLRAHDGSPVAAIRHLCDVVGDILRDGMVSTDERFEALRQIERVLPVRERAAAAEQRRERERRERHARQEEWRARLSAEPTATASWHDEPVTDAQLAYLRALGDSTSQPRTKGEASRLIDCLLERPRPPSARQLMVMRFWGLTIAADASRTDVSSVIDALYTEDEDRLSAWDLFKEEHGDDGSQGPPSAVPFGIGDQYLARVKRTAGVRRVADADRPSNRRGDPSIPVAIAFGVLAAGLLAVVVFGRG